MGKYGKAAVEAANKLRNMEDFLYLAAWENVVQGNTVWEQQNSESSRNKGCPKQAFLGLCRHGLIVGVKGTSDIAVKESINAQYAVAAVEILKKEKKNGRDAPSKEQLWESVCQSVCPGDPDKCPNGQMDVVLELYEEGLLNLE